MSFVSRYFRSKNTKQIFSFAGYDFANSSYGFLLLSFVLPIYFKEVLAVGHATDLWWGVVIGAATLLGGLISPVVGAMGDYDGRRLRRFIIITLLCILGIGSIYFLESSFFFLSLSIIIFTNMLYVLAQALYDSFLVNISTKKNIGKISGFAWGLGYLGGLIAFVIARPLIEPGPLGQQYRLVFPLIACFFFLFALPAFFYLPASAVLARRHAVSSAYRQVLTTLKHIRQHKNIMLFLLGWFVINDALVTVFSFTTLYATTTLGFSVGEVVILFLLVQLVAFPATAFFGFLSDRVSKRKIVLFCLLLWIVIILCLALAYSKPFFYALTVMTGLVVGGLQATLRSWYGQMIPASRKGEFFGFNTFASKIAAVFGPLMFGVVSVLTGNQRFAMLSLGVFFIAGFFIFLHVREK